MTKQPNSWPRLVMATSGLVALALLAAPAVQAADYLRGAYAGHTPAPSSGPDWAGVYAGVHGGITSARSDYTAIGRSLGSRVLPNLAISDQIPGMIHLGSAINQGSSFGAFAGINYLWDDVVMGVEADFTRSSIASRSSSGPLSRALSAPSTGTDQWDTTVSANGRSELKEWMTLRGRVGWAAGYFMPFLTAGIAVGNIESTGTANGSTTQYAVTTDPNNGTPVYTPRGSTSNSVTMRHRGVSYGGVVGAGVDMAFFSNFFVRAEWQYVQFASGGNRPEISINTARVAGAVKF
jgi:opacity protein-like surface antigen